MAMTAMTFISLAISRLPRPISAVAYLSGQLCPYTTRWLILRDSSTHDVESRFIIICLGPVAVSERGDSNVPENFHAVGCSPGNDENLTKSRYPNASAFYEIGDNVRETESKRSPPSRSHHFPPLGCRESSESAKRRGYLFVHHCLQ